MKNSLLVLVFVLFISFASISSALVIELPSWQDTHVNDYGLVLNAGQIDELKGLFTSVQDTTTAEVVFVSLPECAPYAPSDLATKLLNEWGVGNKDKDNGLLILYCKQENKIFVAIGYGLEGILPDSKVGRLLDENYVIQRDAGNVSEGIVLFSNIISNVIVANLKEN